MKKNLLLFAILFIVSCVKSAVKPHDTLVELGTANTLAVVYHYVSPTKQGDGSGRNPQNAADFLSTTIWNTINQQLTNQPVCVKFAEGSYTRAFTEKPLILNGIGNVQHQLTLEGLPNKTVFDAPDNLSLKKGVLIDIKNSQNIHIKNISFTGNGSLGYALRITSDKDKKTTNIRVENCQWHDMRGVIYGAAGAHQKGTSHVTFLDCIFKRVGVDSHSHHIYNAYGPSHIFVINSHFEDCTGDYVRFRDSMDYCLVKGSTFIRNEGFDGKVFISMPIFNSKPPVGDEYFCSNYAFVNNSFVNNSSAKTANAITFYHSGFTPPSWNYLLTPEEGATLQGGSLLEKKELLRANFGIDTDKVRISNNTYSNKIVTQVALGTYPNYGAVTRGFKGWASLTEVINSSNTPFIWESSE